ncbi:MAG: DUF3888 domain-containing protein [Oscillibacter sp.]|nr:DUF3888 domain-containing protein [Oscillibacter sp.]
MRKITAFVAGVVAIVFVLLATGVSAESKEEISSDVSKQIILRLLYQPTTAAVENYYGERRQYWRQEVLSAKKVQDSPYYEVVIQVETFYGPHNPPYGLETMTFYIGPMDQVQLADFNHQDEVD